MHVQGVVCWNHPSLMRQQDLDYELFDTNNPIRGPTCAHSVEELVHVQHCTSAECNVRLSWPIFPRQLMDPIGDGLIGRRMVHVAERDFRGERYVRRCSVVFISFSARRARAKLTRSQLFVVQGAILI